MVKTALDSSQNRTFPRAIVIRLGHSNTAVSINSAFQSVFAIVVGRRQYDGNNMYEFSLC